MRAPEPQPRNCRHQLQNVRLLLWLCACLYSALPARAHAQGLLLDWQAPPACPTEDSVRATVLSWLDQADEPKATDGIEVTAVVRREARGFVLDLRLVTPGGRANEQLVAEACDTLAGVVALKVALAADPVAVLETRPQPRAAPLRWGARLTLGAGPGALPGLGLTLTAAGIMRLGSFAFELNGAYGFQQEVSYPDRPSVGGKLDMLSAGARVCALPSLGSIQFSVCAGPELGLLRGVGFGVATVFQTLDWYAAIAFGPGLRWHMLDALGGMFAYLGVDAQLALMRPRFHVRNLTLLYQPEQLAARLHAGIELHFD